jgi:hypothetical protein
MVFFFIKASKGELEVTVLHILGPKITSPYLCHILLARNKSLDHCTSLDPPIHKGMPHTRLEKQAVGIIGGLL